MFSCRNGIDSERSTIEILTRIIVFLIIFSWMLIDVSSAYSNNILIPDNNKRFTIGGWVGPHQSKYQYEMYKEAGFNTILDYLWEGDDLEKTLKISSTLKDMTIYVNMDQRVLRYASEDEQHLKERIHLIVNKMRSYQGNYGYFFLTSLR